RSPGGHGAAPGRSRRSRLRLSLEGVLEGDLPAAGARHPLRRDAGVHHCHGRLRRHLLRRRSRLHHSAGVHLQFDQNGDFPEDQRHLLDHSRDFHSFRCIVLLRRAAQALTRPRPARSLTMTRRTPLALAVLLATGLAGSAQAAGTLHFANWSDYYPPELLKKFEKDTGIKATLDAYDSNETLLAKLKAGGGAYDVV